VYTYRSTRTAGKRIGACHPISSLRLLPLSLFLSLLVVFFSFRPVTSGKRRAARRVSVRSLAGCRHSSTRSARGASVRDALMWCDEDYRVAWGVLG
jgi:hypothetical protein